MIAAQTTSERARLCTGAPRSLAAPETVMRLARWPSRSAQPQLTHDEPGCPVTSLSRTQERVTPGGETPAGWGPRRRGKLNNTKRGRRWLATSVGAMPSPTGVSVRPTSNLLVD